MVGVVVTIVQAASSSGVSSGISWETILEALAAVATVGSAALWLWRQRKELRVRNERFDRDWFGEPERPGVPARAGVLEQLYSVRTDVGQIRAEVYPNHGGSIKDAVDRIDIRLQGVELDVKGIHERLDATKEV